MDVTSETNLRALDDAIFRVRLRENAVSDAEERAARLVCASTGLDGASPPYSSDRALSMMLLEEMRGGVAFHDDAWWAGPDVITIGEFGTTPDSIHDYQLHRGATPTEAIARAYRAFKRARA